MSRRCWPECDLPIRRDSFTLSAIYPLQPPGSYELGRLHICGRCRTLWRVGFQCDRCDPYGARPHDGQHPVGLRWRRARLVDHWRALRRRL